MHTLTMYEIVVGTLLHMSGSAFQESRLLRLFEELRVEYPAIAYRFGKEALGRTLSFLEMYFIILPPGVYSSHDTIYRINIEMQDSVRCELVRRNVLPLHEKLFSQLATRL